MSNDTELRLASAAVRLFGVVVVAYGLSGVLLPDVWLHAPYMLHLQPLGAERATFLNELRFLEGREIGIGLFALLLREEIVTSRKHNIAFLAAIYAAPAARLYSCVVTGLPNAQWLAFMAIEIFMSTLITVLTRSARRSPLAPPRAAES